MKEKVGSIAKINCPADPPYHGKFCRVIEYRGEDDFEIQVLGSLSTVGCKFKYLVFVESKVSWDE